MKLSCDCHVQASLDEPTESVVLHHAKPTALQNLSFILAEKVQFD